MFGFFRKKKPDNHFVTMLSLDDKAYAAAMEEFYGHMDAPTRAHVLVAYENLIPLVSAMYSALKERGESFSIEQFIAHAAQKFEAAGDDEIGARRWGWFLFAALLARLEKLARLDPIIAESGARIWCFIAQDSPLLKGLLPHNIVWSAEEKDWFDLTKTDANFSEWTVNFAMPPMFAKSGIVAEFARANGLLYYPQKARIGVVP